MGNVKPGPNDPGYQLAKSIIGENWTNGIIPYKVDERFAYAEYIDRATK